MSQLKTPDRLNNFSVLRILFASLVIVSHSFELIDGNRSREPLTFFFGSISFGVFAVDGFFLISGYLITKSFLGSNPIDYVIKRILRIYPAFIMAFLISIVLGEISVGFSDVFDFRVILHNIFNLIFLLGPGISNPYPGSYYAALNGAMWTISYEFHCYLMVLLLGILGFYRKPFIVLAFTAVLVIIYAIHPDIYVTPNNHLVIASRAIQPPAEGFFKMLRAALIENHLQDLRLFGIFLVGSCFCIFERSIRYRGLYAIIAAALLLLSLFSKHLAEPGLAIFGGYLVFWFALHFRPLAISKTLNSTDLSYGIYLYGWPVQKTLIYFIPFIDPFALIILTLFICSVVAFLSWNFIEKPCLALKNRFRARKRVESPILGSV